jgi:hypothetical protein
MCTSTKNSNNNFIEYNNNLLIDSHKKWQVKNKKKLDRGEPRKGMVVPRVAKLGALGFAWEMSAVALSK